MAFDPKWDCEFWFDHIADYSNLRVMQHYSGPEMVEAYKQLFVGERRKQLLKVISLMMLVCGAGKTLQIVATMLHINRVVNGSSGRAPRCGRILWFVKERALAIQLKNELDEEIVKFGLHHRRPNVQICDRPGDLERGPQHHDITISCPHTLWKRKNQLRTDEQILSILAEFDTVIWDECDFAVDQIYRLVKFSPHALKFGLTASPIDCDGDFLRQYFVLAGIASYQQVFEQDRCLKHFLQWDDAKDRGYVRALSHSSYSRLIGGIEASSSGQHGDKHSLPGAMAAVLKSLEDCSDVERAMREAWPQDWYSPHNLIVCQNIDHADAVKAYLDDHLKQHRDSYFGEGWRACAMHDKIDKINTPIREEQRLFHRNPAIVHPFMRAAKLNDGRCDRDCARILVVVDMGIRGMNNWPILFIDDIKRSSSVNVQVQTKGRDSRLPLRLRKFTNHPLFAHFCTGRYYYPESGSNGAVMEKAYDFIWNLEKRLTEAELLHWNDLLNNQLVEQAREPQSPEDPFTLGDRLQIDKALGEIKARGEEITPQDAENILAALSDNISDARREKAKTHIARVTNPHDAGYRRQFVDISNLVMITPVAREVPGVVSSTEELRQFLIIRSLHREMATDLLPLLDDATQPIRQMIEAEYRDYNQRHYLSPNKIFQLHRADGKPGILTNIGGGVSSDLQKVRRLEFARIMQAVTAATSDLTGIKDTSNDGPLDQPSYHYVLQLPHNQGRIKHLAIVLLMRWRVLEELYPVYADVIGSSDDSIA